MRDALAGYRSADPWGGAPSPNQSDIAKLEATEAALRRAVLSIAPDDLATDSTQLFTPIDARAALEGLIREVRSSIKSIERGDV